MAIMSGRRALKSEARATLLSFARLLAKLHAANPKLRALTGETPKRYFALMLFALLGLGAFAFAVIAIPTPF
ncbi:MAG: hypothetical protein NVV62_09575 [Terricaulis sp.]|nr:hypothetical protein [Terricaulis sp.]